MSLVPRRFLHGCAALLALVLSALGGARVGIERLSGQDPAEDQVIVRSATVGCAIVADEPELRRAIASPPLPKPTISAPAPALAVTATQPCALLLGSARGPRAP
jgi:hypothetical protein